MTAEHIVNDMHKVQNEGIARNNFISDERAIQFLFLQVLRDIEYHLSKISDRI